MPPRNGNFEMGNKLCTVYKRRFAEVFKLWI